MVLPAKGSSSSSSSSTSSSKKPAPSLLKKPHQLQQSRLQFQPGGGGASSSSSSRQQATGRLVQASIFDLAGVQQHQQQMSEADVGVAPTLYLGEADLLRLKETLEDRASDRESLLRVLRRLSTVPCTRRSLEETRIGVAVGHLRRHDDDEVSDLAERCASPFRDTLRLLARKSCSVLLTFLVRVSRLAGSSPCGSGRSRRSEPRSSSNSSARRATTAPAAAAAGADTEEVRCA